MLLAVSEDSQSIGPVWLVLAQKPAILGEGIDRLERKSIYSLVRMLSSYVSPNLVALQA
jgi:hypothetical protein